MFDDGPAVSSGSTIWLSERYARVLTLHHFAGLDRAELAREFDVAEDTASTLLRRAKVRLSRELQPAES